MHHRSANTSEEVIARYSQDLERAGADKTLLNREWVNSRGVIFRFDRCALEVRVMDEQECVKSDVAFACFVRAALRGLIASNTALLPHDVLVKDFNAIIVDGLRADSLKSPWQNGAAGMPILLQISSGTCNSKMRKNICGL